MPLPYSDFSTVICPDPLSGQSHAFDFQSSRDAKGVNLDTKSTEIDLCLQIKSITPALSKDITWTSRTP